MGDIAEGVRAMLLQESFLFLRAITEVSARSQVAVERQAYVHTSPVTELGLLCGAFIESSFAGHRGRLPTRYHTWFE